MGEKWHGAPLAVSRVNGREEMLEGGAIRRRGEGSGILLCVDVVRESDI